MKQNGSFIGENPNSNTKHTTNDYIKWNQGIFMSLTKNRQKNLTEWFISFFIGIQKKTAALCYGIS